MSTRDRKSAREVVLLLPKVRFMGEDKNQPATICVL